MSNIRNPFVFTPTGEAMPVAAPPHLRVMQGQATPEQLDMAQKVFYQFCSRARLSVVPNPREAGRLPDGSRYEIIVVGTVQTMLLWPVGSDAGGPFIAWTAFFTSSYLPIWERPLVDFPYDDLPPKPLPPGPAPAYPQLAITGLAIETETPAPGTTLTRYIAYADVVGVGRIAEATAEGTVTVSDAACGASRFVAINYPVPGSYAEGGESISEIFTYSYDYVGYEGVTSVTGGIIVTHLPDPCSSESPSVEIFVPRVNTGIRVSVGNAAGSYNVGAVAAWEAAYAAWEAANAQYLIDLAAWQAERDELLALQRPWWPVNDARKDARPAQVAAVKAHLLTGIGDRHLTARILSFPYNVAYRSVPAVGAGGSITNTAETTDTVLGFKTELVDAEPFTTIPRWDDGPNEMYPERPLRLDFMPPHCLFGWKANGAIQYGYRFYMENPRTEHYVLMPPGLEDVAVSVPQDYFSYTRVKPDPAPGLVVASDAFVPVGSVITVVFFEYRVADPHTGEIYWTECPDLMQHDSIWIRDTGVYIDTPRAVDPLFTERVRLAGAITQRRTAWGTWSAPVVTPRGALVQGGWEAAYVAAVEYERPTKAPAAVVLARDLHAAANPSPVQTGVFFMGAKALWSGAPDPVRAARARPWDSDATTAPQEQFIVRALIAAGRIKP